MISEFLFNLNREAVDFRFSSPHVQWMSVTAEHRTVASATVQVSVRSRSDIRVITQTKAEVDRFEPPEFYTRVILRIRW
jgi:hypothetical protein